MNYELKKTYPAEVKLNDDNTATIKQAFNTGVVGCPYQMYAGDNISITIENVSSKTSEQINTEVLAAVNTFIANKYPST